MPRTEESDVYLGLISGTSMDGIDAIAVRFAADQCEVVESQLVPYPENLRVALTKCRHRDAALSLESLGQLDRAIGIAFGEAAASLIMALPEGSNVAAIGSHGQTLWHAPDGPSGFSLQLGDPNSIAERTGVATVADFRRADIARGGQGAPLAPLFHDYLFRNENEATILINLGGIANVTVLTPGIDVAGFDTGPANGLMDQWMSATSDQMFDNNGALAGSGEADAELLDRLLSEPYFMAPSPKSTGFERFNLEWLNARAGDRLRELTNADVMATLLALSVRTIADSIDARDEPRIALMGGGCSNPVFANALEDALRPGRFFDPCEAGIDADWIEAALFAWLARARLNGQPVNTPPITGASHAGLLGAIYASSQT